MPSPLQSRFFDRPFAFCTGGDHDAASNSTASRVGAPGVDGAKSLMMFAAIH